MYSGVRMGRQRASFLNGFNTVVYEIFLSCMNYIEITEITKMPLCMLNNLIAAWKYKIAIVYLFF